jgi:hypothetical protein
MRSLFTTATLLSMVCPAKPPYGARWRVSQLGGCQGAGTAGNESSAFPESARGIRPGLEQQQGQKRLLLPFVAVWNHTIACRALEIVTFTPPGVRLCIGS